MAFKELTENEKEAISELQSLYEYYWNSEKYKTCEDLIGVFCILNKHLTGHTGWRIRFEGSKADELINARERNARERCKKKSDDT